MDGEHRLSMEQVVQVAQGYWLCTLQRLTSAIHRVVDGLPVVKRVAILLPVRNRQVPHVERGSPIYALEVVTGVNAEQIAVEVVRNQMFDLRRVLVHDL